VVKGDELMSVQCPKCGSQNHFVRDKMIENAVGLRQEVADGFEDMPEV
jgi:hypothetical protein